MLIAKNISKKYNSIDDHNILNKINFSLNENEIVGLIGENGSGKSTLFKIIMGEVLPDEGYIEISGGRSAQNIIGYLPQDPQFNNQNIRNFLSTYMLDTSQSYKIEIVLDKVGLSNLNLDQTCDLLSGGQKTKIYLAALLLKDPEILLLDEPTNNLDMDGLLWLENFVQNFKGSILVISHDRQFLDICVDRVLELHDGNLKSYGGNYSFYREQKLLEKEAYLKRYEHNQAEIHRLERLIIRKRERARRLAKDKRQRDNDVIARNFFREKSKTIDREAKAVESRLEKVQRVDRPDDRKSYDFGFKGRTHNGKLILRVANLNKSLDLKVILKNISFELRGSNHYWLSGKNGSGKSTLLKILAGKIPADLGEIEWGSNINFGYFSQDSSQLDMSDTGLEILKSTKANVTDCFTLAAYLHLTESDLRKKVGDLSSGQRTKLEFVKLLLEDNQLLILDEPTNHLEIETREEIEEALQSYKGAILVASHDRYFLEELDIDIELDLAKLNN